MERKRILIADNDLREIQELRKLLVVSGYEVRIVDNGAAALNHCREFRPHLVLSEVKLPKIDGHHLLRELKSQSATKSIPFVLMSRHRTVDERVHSIRLGVDDYITKPFQSMEVLVRLEIILKEIEILQSTSRNKTKGFSGKLSEMNLVDLLRTLEIGGKTGLIKLQQDSREGTVFMKSGEVYDSTLENLDPNEAIMRMITWTDGSFRVDIQDIDRPRVIRDSMSKLLYQASIRRDRWVQLSKRLPPLGVVVQKSPRLAQDRLSENEKELIQLINGKSRVIDLIESSELDDLKALKIIGKLFSRGSLKEVTSEPTCKNGNPLRNNYKNGSLNHQVRLEKLISKFLTSTGEASGSENKAQPAGGSSQPESHNKLTNNSEVRPPIQNQIYLHKSELLMIREKLSKEIEQAKSSL